MKSRFVLSGLHHLIFDLTHLSLANPVAELVNVMLLVYEESP